MAKNKKTLEQKQLDQVNKLNKINEIDRSINEGLFSPFLKKLFNSKVERAMKKATSDAHFKHLIKKFNRSLKDLEMEFEKSAKVMDREIELSGGLKDYQKGATSRQRNYMAAMKALYPDMFKNL